MEIDWTRCGARESEFKLKSKEKETSPADVVRALLDDWNYWNMAGSVKEIDQQ